MFDRRETAGKGGESGSDDGFCSSVQLYVINVTVELKAMMLNYVSKGDEVENEQRGPST